MPKLLVIICSVRDGRAGDKVAHWFFEKASAHGAFDCELVDLREVNLPVFDEPNHPMKKQYTKEHTKRWSAIVERGDAYVFVTPEYNYGMPPGLNNALNYLYKEWSYKPAAFVSYGGISGGTRSAQAARAMCTVLKMMGIPDQVTLPAFTQHLKEGKFDPGDIADRSIKGMLDELKKWSDALATMRT